jgi:hypothetical protein
VLLKAVDATFSGTETMVRVAIEPISTSSADELSIPQSAIRLTGFEEGSVVTGRISSVELLLELPPVRIGQVPTIAITQLKSRTVSGSTAVGGEWSLSLTTPERAELVKLLELQMLATGRTESGGVVIQVSAVRSSSRTLVQYELPDGLEELAPPRLTMSDGATTSAFKVSPLGEGVWVAAFPRMAFTESFEVSFGPFVRGVDDESSIRLALGSLDAASNAMPGRPVVLEDFSIAEDPDSLLQGVEVECAGTDQNGSAWS